MRELAVAVILLVGLVPATAEACETSNCGRWFGLEPTRDEFPRDAAIVFAGSSHLEVCDADLHAHAEVTVRRGDEVVAGSFTAPVSLHRELVWLPAAPLEPGEYTLTVAIDNAALDAALGVTPDPSCGPDVYGDTIAFLVGSDMSPPAPAVVPPPTFATLRRPLNASWQSLACCPGVAPIAGVGADCQPGIGPSGDAGDCIYFYDYDYLTIASEPFPSTDGHDSLWLYQLVVDGAVVDRGMGGMSARRSERACAHVEAIHLGTGEVVGSEVACPPDDLVPGARAHEPEFALRCEQALACGTADGWAPELCQAYVVGEPPFSPGPTRPDTELTTRCEAPAPVTMPVYPEPEPAPAGCGCSLRSRPGPGLLVGVVLIALRRRRRR